MANDIEAISIKVSGNASGAKRSLDQLCATLGKLATKTTAAASGLTAVNSALARTARAANSIKPTGIDKLAQSIGNLKLTKTNLGNIERLPSVLARFSQFNGAAFTAQAAQVASGLDKMSAAAGRYTQAMSAMPRSMRGIATMSRSVAAANTNLSRASQQASSSMSNVSSSTDDASGSAGTLSARLTPLLSKLDSIRMVTAALSNSFGKALGEASQYIEDQNLAAVVLEEHYSSMYDFWNSAQNLMGVDAAQAIKYQGYFQELMTGMGIAGDEAANMSKQLTQLGYDLSSFENLSVDDAMLKLQSGISGELEPLRRIGFDLSQARMEQDKYKLSMEGSVATMTQAEKTYIRYWEIMNQVTESHGDLARSLNSPMNQIRIFQSQVQILARSLGFLLVPALNAVLPYLTALVKLLIQAAQAVAMFFGVDPSSWMADLSTVDTTSLQGSTAGIADNMDKTASGTKKAAKAAKEFRKQLLGFDQINNITDTKGSDGGSGGGGGGGAGGGSGFKLPNSDYDFFNGLANSAVDKAMENLKKMGPLLLGILKTWKAIALAAKNAKEFVKGVVTGMKSAKFSIKPNSLKLPKAFERGYSIAVRFKETKLGQTVLKWKTAIEKGLSAIKVGFAETKVGKVAASLGKLFAGKFSKAGDLSKVGSILGPLSKELKKVLDMPLIGKALSSVGKFLGPLGTILSIVDGIRGVGSIFESVTQGKDIAMGDIASVATSAIGLGAIFGPTGMLVGAIIGGVAAIAAFIYNKREQIKGFFSGAAEWVSTKVIQPVKKKLGEIADWFKTNVVNPVGEKITGIAAFLSGLFETAKGIFAAIANVVLACFIIAKQYVSEKFVKPVKTAMGKLWEKIKTIFGKAASWVNAKVIQPVVAKVKSMKAKVTAVASSIKSAFSKAFNSVKSAAVTAFSGVASAIRNAFSKVKSVVQGIVNRIIDGVNIFIGGLQKVSDVASKVTGKDIHINTLQHISFAADGGVFGNGQMFVAREAGPEMVGQYGNKSAVVNNDQIVEAVSRGVAQAVSAVMSGQKGSGDTEVNVRLYLDGREVIKSINRAQRRAGKVLLEV